MQLIMALPILTMLMFTETAEQSECFQEFSETVLSNFIISSKIGWFPGTAEHAYVPAHIRHQCEQSLINLKRDYIDIYYFHHANYGENYKYVDDAVEVMYRLKEEGKIRVIGQCAKTDKEYEFLIPKVNPEVIQSSSSALNDYLFLKEQKPVS